MYMYIESYMYMYQHCLCSANLSRFTILQETESLKIEPRAINRFCVLVSLSVCVCMQVLYGLCTNSAT